MTEPSAILLAEREAAQTALAGAMQALGVHRTQLDLTKARVLELIERCHSVGAHDVAIEAAAILITA